MNQINTLLSKEFKRKKKKQHTTMMYSENTTTAFNSSQDAMQLKNLLAIPAETPLLAAFIEEFITTALWKREECHVCLCWKKGFTTGIT